MTSYIGKPGHSETATPLTQASSGDDAVEQAEQILRECLGYEVWDERRLIYRFTVENVR